MWELVADLTRCLVEISPDYVAYVEGFSCVDSLSPGLDWASHGLVIVTSVDIGIWKLNVFKWIYTAKRDISYRVGAFAIKLCVELKHQVW